MSSRGPVDGPIVQRDLQNPSWPAGVLGSIACGAPRLYHSLLDMLEGLLELAASSVSPVRHRGPGTSRFLSPTFERQSTLQTDAPFPRHRRLTANHLSFCLKPDDTNRALDRQHSDAPARCDLSHVCLDPKQRFRLDFCACGQRFCAGVPSGRLPESCPSQVTSGAQPPLWDRFHPGG
jgi:hypothetical protein